MDNLHYDIIKLLKDRLAEAWSIERHYFADAENAGCAHCREALEKFLVIDREQIEMISRELIKHGAEWTK